MQPFLIAVALWLGCAAQLVFAPGWASRLGRSGATWFMLTAMWVGGCAYAGGVSTLYVSLLDVLHGATPTPSWPALVGGLASLVPSLVLAVAGRDKNAPATPLARLHARRRTPRFHGLAGHEPFRPSYGPTDDVPVRVEPAGAQGPSRAKSKFELEPAAPARPAPVPAGPPRRRPSTTPRISWSNVGAPAMAVAALAVLCVWALMSRTTATQPTAPSVTSGPEAAAPQPIPQARSRDVALPEPAAQGKPAAPQPEPEAIDAPPAVAETQAAPETPEARAAREPQETLARYQQMARSDALAKAFGAIGDATRGRALACTDAGRARLLEYARDVLEIAKCRGDVEQDVDLDRLAVVAVDLAIERTWGPTSEDAGPTFAKSNEDALAKSTAPVASTGDAANVHEQATPLFATFLAPDQWTARCDAIRNLLLTTPERVARLRALADSVVIQCRGKIRDIEPATWRGADTTQVFLCPIYGGADFRSFILPPDEKAAAATWRKWDRVAWRVRASVDDQGEISYRAIYDTLADLVRTPDPGVEAEPLLKPQGSPTSFVTWLDRLATASYFDGASAVSGTWNDGVKKTYVFPATVQSLGERALVKLSVKAYYDLFVDMPVPGAKPTFGVQLIWHESRKVGRWGFAPDAQIWARVQDPQMASELSIGDRIEVALDLDPAGAARARQGQIAATIWVWKLKTAKK